MFILLLPYLSINNTLLCVRNILITDGCGGNGVCAAGKILYDEKNDILFILVQMATPTCGPTPFDLRILHATSLKWVRRTIIQPR